MILINLLKTRDTLFKLILLISALFVQSCSNDERLEGYRQSVLTEQKFYETKEKNHKLALSKPKNIISWTHGAVSYTHLRAHETRHDLVCRLLLEKKKKK